MDLTKLFFALQEKPMGQHVLCWPHHSSNQKLLRAETDPSPGEFTSYHIALKSWSILLALYCIVVLPKCTSFLMCSGGKMWPVLCPDLWVACKECSILQRERRQCQLNWLEGKNTFNTFWMAKDRSHGWTCLLNRSKSGVKVVKQINGQDSEWIGN